MSDGNNPHLTRAERFLNWMADNDDRVFYIGLGMCVIVWIFGG